MTIIIINIGFTITLNVPPIEVIDLLTAVLLFLSALIPYLPAKKKKDETQRRN